VACRLRLAVENAVVVQEFEKGLEKSAGIQELLPNLFAFFERIRTVKPYREGMKTVQGAPFLNVFNAF
jgi:hypothetical protein